MCKHLFFPPFWKCNKFCIFCGRLKDLQVGMSTITLDNTNKITFGGSASLTASKELGFNNISRLIFRDDSGEKVVMNTDEVGEHQVVKIDEWFQSEVTITEVPETVITNRSISFDFNKYSYFVIDVIPRNRAELFEFLNTSSSYFFTLFLYPWSSTTSRGAYFKWETPSFRTVGYIIRIVYHPFNPSAPYQYRAVMYVKDREVGNLNYVVNTSGRNLYAGAMSSADIYNNPPNQVKLTGGWSGTGATFKFYDSYFVVYGYKP